MFEGGSGPCLPACLLPVAVRPVAVPEFLANCKILLVAAKLPCVAILFHVAGGVAVGMRVCGRVLRGTGGGAGRLSGTGSTPWLVASVLSCMGAGGGSERGWEGREEAPGVVVEEEGGGRGGAVRAVEGAGLSVVLRRGSFGFESSVIDLSWLSSLAKMLLKDVLRDVCKWVNRARMDGWTSIGSTSRLPALVGVRVGGSGAAADAA